MQGATPCISKLPNVPNEEMALKNYEAEQQQRYMERMIRKYKRLEAGSLDAENVNKASDKVKQWQEKLRQHLNENPQLRRSYSREKLLGDIDLSSNNDIISGRKWLKSDFSTLKRLSTGKVRMILL